MAGLLDGRRIHADTSLVVATSPEIKFAADRMGLTRRIEDAGGIVAAGVCFYQSYAREMAEANGWQRLLTNSAKLVNIIAGYGYKPTLASMERCIDSAVAGKDPVMPIVLKCHKGHRPGGHRHGAGGATTTSPPATTSTALEGTFSRPAHKLYGQSYVDKVLVLVTAKGGVASAWMLREMAARGMAPKAIVFDRANTILAQGAAFAELTHGRPLRGRLPHHAHPHRRRAADRAGQGPGDDPQPRLTTRHP